MKVFIGSSYEARQEMRKVARWIEDDNHQALSWDDPGVFMPGDQLFTKLRKISQQVDAAIFIFSEDDKVWYREDMTTQPRDNILLEFGLFAGQLSAERTIICKKGNPKQPIDLGGIVCVDLNRPNDARIRIQEWIADLPIEVTRQTSKISLSKENFRHLCGITLLKEYIYHDKYFRREMYSLKDNGYIQPKPPHKSLEFYEGFDQKNLAEFAEPTELGRLTVKLHKNDIPPELLADKENLKVDPFAL